MTRVPPSPPSPVGRWSSRGAALLLAAFAVFQIALALGAPLGAATWGGSSAVLSPTLRAASFGAAIYLVLATLVMLVRAGDLRPRLPTRVFWWINLVLAGQLALNTLANLASTNTFERFGMGAASALGCGLCSLALLRAGKTS
jgi:hypothetical protein